LVTLESVATAPRTALVTNVNEDIVMEGRVEASMLELICALLMAESGPVLAIPATR
jgi:hypothetical protein